MSRISSISIRRPVLASVMSIVIVILGLIAYPELGVREYPVVEPPVIRISTSYSGANADIVEREITDPIETQVNAVSGIRTISSTSLEGRSLIRVEFDIDVDFESAANELRDRVSRALDDLPDDARPPSVRLEDEDSDPIIFLNLSSDVRDRLELTQIARDVFRDRVRTIDGFSTVRVYGQQRYTIRLWMDPDLLAAYDVSPLDIQNALDRENIELPAGTIEGNDTELTIRAMGRMTDLDEFNSLIIREENGNVIRFQDVGYAEMSTRDDRTVLKKDGVPQVGLAMIPQPGANQITAADELFRRVELIKEELPEDIEVTVGFDNTEFIRESIRDVQTTLFVAFGLVVVIIFLFLRNFRTTFIPIIVVPIALIGTFFVMYMAGYTINSLTMLALILAIGLVVDDAIIVLENIYAKLEQGLPPIQAGIEGTKEIFFAIIATTLALVSVFTPILFLEGVTGRLFREFGIVMTGAVIISSFVALTLTPMLSSKFLKSGNEPTDFYKRTEPFFRRLSDSYRNQLESFLAVRHKAFWIFGGVSLLTVFFFMFLQEEIAPLEDRSFITINATAPEGSTFHYTDRVMDQVIEVVQNEVPEANVLNTTTGRGARNTAEGFINLQKPGDRTRSQTEIASRLGEELAKLPGAQVSTSQQQTLATSNAAGLPVQFVVQAHTLEALRDIVPQFLNTARDHPAFSFVDVDLKFNNPELRIEIDRDRARSLGVTVQDIVRTLQLAYSGSRFGNFAMDGRQYWVQGLVYDEHRSSPKDVENMKIRNNNGDLITMDNLVNFVEDSSPPEIFRYNRMTSATFSASLAEGYTLGNGIAAMRSIADDLLGEEYFTELSGASRDFEESTANLNFIFIFAIVFIYLVLAAQFESFRDPFTILFTVPLALFGSVVFIWYFGETLNIFSKIAMIMLIGLVTKNGILIVEFANQRQEQGLSLMEAIKDASVARFRPILMTTCSTVLGILPLAVSLGTGSESRVSLGIAVVGGLLVGTFLSLFLIPAIYTYFASDKQENVVEEYLRGS
jgi:multidrug efflux pump